MPTVLRIGAYRFLNGALRQRPEGTLHSSSAVSLQRGEPPQRAASLVLL